MKKILVVDDKKEGRYLLESMLHMSGYRVVAVSNGIEALKSLREDSFDAIISDLLMPGMDGFQLLRSCKNDPDLQKIPFIVYTAAYTDKKDEEFAIHLGADRYLVRPMEPDEFIEVVRSVLQEVPDVSSTKPVPDLEKDVPYLDAYSRRIITKLDEKVVELEEKEAELKKRGEQYQYLVENISDVIFVIDVKGTITYISPRVVPMTGYLEKDLEGQPYKGFVYPDDLEDVEIGLKSILEGINQPIFFRILDKDGKVRHIRVTGRPIMTGARVLGITGVASDVTEETLAKQELGEKEAQLRTFLANFGGVAYQVKIKPFRPVLYLGLVKEITGYTKEELLSGDITWDGIVLPEYIENLRKNRLKAEKAPGSSYSMLYRIRRKDGIIRWVYDIGQSLVLPGDGGLLIQGAIYDITDRKETEEEIRRAVQQITRNIEQMAILNDQIRNPLAVIVGLADMNPGELSDKILKQAEHINAIITELDRGWLDSEIVHEILRRHKYTLEEK